MQGLGLRVLARGFEVLGLGLLGLTVEGSVRHLEVQVVNRIQGLRLKVNPRKLEHGFRRIGARIPYTLP